MPIKRKTVTYLRTLAEDVDAKKCLLHELTEHLEAYTFDLTNIDLDEIRNDEAGYVKSVYNCIKVCVNDVNKALADFKKACDTYKEFF